MTAAATPAERWHAVLRTALAETYIATTARERNVMAAKYRSVAVDLRSISTRIQGDSYLNTIASDLDDMAALIQPASSDSRPCAWEDIESRGHRTLCERRAYGGAVYCDYHGRRQDRCAVCGGLRAEGGHQRCETAS